MLLLALACNKDPVLDTGSPELFAPTSEGTGSGALSAGAAAVDITPVCFESWVDLDADAELDDDEEYLDCGCDRLCPDDEGYVSADEGEGDGEFQAVWIAGFQNNRPASGVRDPIWARALVLEQGDLRIGIVTLDLVGWMHPEVVSVREAATDLDLDHITVMSTHTHEGPDALGLWGRTETKSGFAPEFREQVVQGAAQALADADAEVRAVGELVVGSVDASSYAEIGILNILQDKRDPKVVDVELSAAILRDTSGGTIATLAHFGNHPEATADDNSLISSDYVHALREGLEDGVEYEAYSREGYGGVALFLTGTVGGMMTPLGITHTDPDGVERRDYSFEKTDAIGRTKAEMAMDAIDGGERVDSPTLAFAQHQFELPVENWGFQAMFLTGIIDREIYSYDDSQPIDEDNVPFVKTEIVRIGVGPIELLTLPGEVLPELSVGGYDGSNVGTTYDDIIEDDNENPPDLSAAPEGPYWKELLPGDDVWVLNLANDEIGYIIPPYNFKLHPSQPWFEEADGDHYEETRSLGKDTATLLDAEIKLLLAWVDEHQR